MSTADVETLVVGAGVVGLAIGAALARSGREVLILERNSAIGQETSSRSSEVIHAGIYYPKGSLKALLCVEGRKRLYAFAAENGVNFLRTGKLIVATTPVEVERLAGIAKAAAANGVDDMQHLTAAQVSHLEPEVHCLEALLSPSTGIIDSHGLMVALEGHLTSRGASVVLGTDVTAIMREPSGLFHVETVNEGETSVLTADTVIVAAGHGMAALAPKLPRQGAYQPPPPFIAKGHYYSLRRKAPFSHLIYPIPVDGGLGVHLTLDLQGQARFGPDVQWIDTLDYSFDDQDGRRRSDFAASVQRYWPAVTEDDLISGYTGIRPKICGPGAPAADFAIHGPKDHGVQKLVALYGIESPGITASLAIANHVTQILGYASVDQPSQSVLAEP
jgi:L-2-hydroxyglutarate oxidase LhgO